MRILFLISVLSSAALTFGQTVVNKRVEADCRHNPDDSSITLTFYIAFNGDPVERLLALSGETFVRNADGSTNVVECQYTGNLAADGSVFVTSKVYYDGNPGSNVCGGRRIPDAIDTLYQWTFEVRQRYSDGIYTGMDRTYSVVCNLDNTHGSFIIPTSVVYVYGEDIEGSAERVKPENQMSVLERTDNTDVFGQEVGSGVDIGQQVKLRVQSKVKNAGLRQVSLDHYGVFPFSCDYRTSLTGDRTEFIQYNGCPNSVFSDLASGFLFTQYVASNEVNFRLFQTETSAFVLTNTVPPNNFYYIGCYVGYCRGSEGSDGRCSNYCATNTRRRRSVNSTSDMDRISIAVRITDLDQSTVERNKSETEQTMLITILSTVIVVVVIIIVGLVMFLCLRRRQRERRQWKNISPSSSVNNYPVQITPDQLKTPKF